MSNGLDMSGKHQRHFSMLVSLMMKLSSCGDIALGVGTISRECKALVAECESHFLTWITMLKGGDCG